jgi:dihydropyrimidine dehydrogenase (NAD+) subunit PreT
MVVSPLTTQGEGIARMSGQTSFVQQAPVHPETSARFGDLHPPLDRQAAIPEANRCLYCFDAPCTAACPTHIDVPRFIKKIASGNLAGSARTILDANILGASCARACPVEVLCEGSCVMHRYNKQPIQIARLQRFAMDSLHASGAPLPFTPAADTGRSVALIGAGPASLACAAELRRRGIRAILYDARPLPGGLNTYGVAEYKLPLVESLREIEMLSQLGVEFHFDALIDAQGLTDLERDHDAVFLGIGLGTIHKLGVPRRTARRNQRARPDRWLQIRSMHRDAAACGRHRCRQHRHRRRRCRGPAGFKRCTHRLPPRRGADVRIRL